MTRLCLALMLVASACFMSLAMSTDSTTTGSSTTSEGSSSTTTGFRGLITRRVERQADPEDDDGPDDAAPRVPGGVGNDDVGQQQPQQPPSNFQARSMRQTVGGSRPVQPLQQQQLPVGNRPTQVPQQFSEDATRLLRQATTDFAADQDQGQPGLAGRHNTQFQGPQRPQPAPRPGQRPGPSRPQPQPQPGPSALTLPDGADLIIGAVQPGFSCDDKIYGYYADTFNDCRLFHVCVPSVDPNGVTHNQQWSFICGNTTKFNQEALICDHEDNVDCSQAQNFYNVNENFGRPEDKTGAPVRG